jgi:hypothetical protein
LVSCGGSSKLRTLPELQAPAINEEMMTEIPKIALRHESIPNLFDLN